MPSELSGAEMEKGSRLVCRKERLRVKEEEHADQHPHVLRAR